MSGMCPEAGQRWTVMSRVRPSITETVRYWWVLDGPEPVEDGATIRLAPAASADRLAAAASQLAEAFARSRYQSAEGKKALAEVRSALSVYLGETDGAEG